METSSFINELLAKATSRYEFVAGSEADIEQMALQYFSGQTILYHGCISSVDRMQNPTTVNRIFLTPDLLYASALAYTRSQWMRTSNPGEPLVYQVDLNLAGLEMSVQPVRAGDPYPEGGADYAVGYVQKSPHSLFGILEIQLASYLAREALASSERTVIASGNTIVKSLYQVRDMFDTQQLATNLLFRHRGNL